MTYNCSHVNLCRQPIWYLFTNVNQFSDTTVKEGPENQTMVLSAKWAEHFGGKINKVTASFVVEA